MNIADNISGVQALIGTIGPDELEFLRGLVAGNSTTTIACRLKLERTEALEVKESLMRKLGVKQTADAVRIGIYAGL